MCAHTFTPNSMTRQQVQQFAQATQQSDEVHGIQSFVNLSEGKAVCIIEAQDKNTLLGYFRKMGMPVDWVSQCQLQGQQGIVQEIQQQQPAAAGIHA
jgi:hypothetical protein